MNATDRHQNPVLPFLLAAAFLGGCGRAAPADTTAGADPVPGDPAPATPASGTFDATSASGKHVVLRLGEGPVVAGELTARITVQSGDASFDARSVDLVSPTMPMHGVVRFPVEDGQARLVVPMEGRWALYVNLDEAGTDAVEFVFDVRPNEQLEGGGHEHHGGTSRPDPGSGAQPGHVHSDGG